MHGASCSRGCRQNRPRYEVADLARSAADQLLRSHPLTPEQQRVLRDITRCRTAALGGHLEVCRDCGLERPVYDSCCNRHCPKCQALAAQRWLDRRLDQYLGRYTHRVGISNHRLLRVGDGTVTFRTRHRQTETCSVVEFLRRFLGHVLPRGFVRIRHYGLLASRNVPTRLAQAQRCLCAGKTFTPRRLRRRPADWRSWYRDLTGVDLRRCPRCGHDDIECRPLPRARPPPCIQVTS
jgi:hypothetical protein